MWLHDLPMYLQHEQSDCGHACVAMVASFFGHDIDLNALRLRFPTSEHGVTLLDLKYMCWQLQLQAVALKVKLEDLCHMSLPAILHWECNHFVVLKKIKKHTLWIHDPALGQRKCTIEEVSRSFTGILLIVDKIQPFNKMNWRQQLTLRHFIKQVKGLGRVAFFMFILSVCSECVSLIPGLVMQCITDYFLDSVQLQNVMTFLSAAFFVMFIGILLNYMRGHYLLSFSLQIKSQLHLNIMRHLLKLPVSYFQKRHTAQIQFLFHMIEDIQKKISTEWIEGAIDSIFLLITVGIMFYYSITLSIVVGGWLIISMIGRILGYQSLKSAKQRALHQRGKYQFFSLETLQCILPLKAAAKEVERWHQWRDVLTISLNEEARVTHYQILYHAWSQSVKQAEYICLLFVGIYFIVKQQLSIGMLIAFLAYRSLFVEKIYQLMQRIIEYQLMQTELEKLADLFTYPVEKDDQHVSSILTVQGSLFLKNIGFRYGVNHPWLFKHVHLDIQQGEKVMIIGPSGIGKSTLLKLMMGFLLPTQGELYVDTVKLSQTNLASYRRLIGAVMQSDSLLSGSILENIVFFDPQVDTSWLSEVLIYVALSDWVATLPMGIETRVGEQGCLMSGGQRQRLLLARALYRRPKILFLDEISSQWDIALETHIDKALQALHITQIMVAHRPETIARADHVFDLGQCNKA